MYTKKFYIIEWTAALFMMAFIAISIRLGVDFIGKIIAEFMH